VNKTLYFNQGARKMKNLKMIFAGLAVVLVLMSAAACDGLIPDNEDGKINHPIGTLTISNSATYTLENIRWNGETFFDSSMSNSSLVPGASREIWNAPAGSDYIYFSGGRTASKLEIKAWEDKQFTFTNATSVVPDNSGTPCTLQQLFSGTSGTSLTIRNESSVTLTGVTYAGVSFGFISSGASSSKTVNTGTGYIRFTVLSGSTTFRVSDIVEAVQDQNRSVTITNNTVIAEDSNPANTTTLGTLSAPSTSMLKIK
jgi:hypothetical protein